MAVQNQGGGIAYGPQDRNVGGRGMSTMGGVPPITNPLPEPPMEKNGAGPDILGDNEINNVPNPITPELGRYQTQAIPTTWPQ